MLQTMLIKLGLSLFKLLPLKQNFLCHKRGQVVAGFGLLIFNALRKEMTMKPPILVTLRHMTLCLKKYFSGTIRRSARCCPWSLCTFSILFIYTVIRVTSVIALCLQGFRR